MGIATAPFSWRRLDKKLYHNRSEKETLDQANGTYRQKVEYYSVFATECALVLAVESFA